MLELEGDIKKTICDLDEIYYLTDQKIQVHAFICLLGLTLTALLQKEGMENYGENSNEKVIKILDKMNPTQSELWNIILKI